MSKEYDLGRVVGRDATINGQNAIELIAGDNIQITNDEGNVTISLDGELDNPHFNDKDNPHNVTTEQIGAVPIERTINGKPLSENISLSASDVGASVIDHIHIDKQDRLTGTENQYVGFDKDGNAVAKLMDYSLFGFQIDLDESDPSKKIKYVGQNRSYDSAYMDFEKDEFNYGDWADAWFIKGIKVVAMKSDGTIITLNNDDYSYLASGIKYNITGGNLTNVMIGIPTVWIRYIELNGKPTFYFSDVQLDSNYKAYAHTNANGDIIPYTYLSAYNGWKDDDGKLRSYSNKLPTVSETGTEQITSARENNPTGKTMWDIDVLADRQLINLLLLLIGKSTDTQAVFGNGNMNGYTNHADGADSNGVLPTGTMNNKGLFWGSNADNKGVKVFGIENWWGNVYRRTQGLILQDGELKFKMTHGTHYACTAIDYNDTGDGYAKVNSANITDGGYIKNMKAMSYGLFPISSNGSNTTYFADYVQVLQSSSTGIGFALFGGGSINGSHCGAFACNLSTLVSYSHWSIGACLSCKPE